MSKSDCNYIKWGVLFVINAFQSHTIYAAYFWLFNRSHFLSSMYENLNLELCRENTKKFQNIILEKSSLSM